MYEIDAVTTISAYGFSVTYITNVLFGRSNSNGNTLKLCSLTNVDIRGKLTTIGFCICLPNLSFTVDNTVSSIGGSTLW